MGCGCTWQRPLPCETNTGATKDIPALNQSWRGCIHPTSIWPYQGNQVPYLVPRSTDCLSPLWSNTKHWPYALGVCSGTGMLWWILHSWLVEYSLWDNSRDLQSGVPTRRYFSIWYEWLNILYIWSLESPLIRAGASTQHMSTSTGKSVLE